MCDHNFYQHLSELKRRLLLSIACVGTLFIALFYFSRSLFEWFAQPLLAQYYSGTALIAIDITTPILTPIKFTLVLSLFIAIPFLLFQFWSFVAPGLYANERKPIWRLAALSTALFYLGVAFVYSVVLPLLFDFFMRWVPSYVLFMPDMSHYLSFSLKLFFAFGLAFQVPVVMLIAWRSGLISLESLQKGRAYVIVIAFILGMLLTPPDVLSQILLAIPICLLYELGLLLIRYLQPRRNINNSAATS